MHQIHELFPLFPLLSAPAVLAKEVHGQGQGANKKTQRGPRCKGGPADRGFHPLAEKDGLWFRSGSLCVHADESTFWVDEAGDQNPALQRGFHRAFNQVWGRIPPADRQILLGYWRAPSWPDLQRHPQPSPVPRPLIQVVDLESLTSAHEVCSRLGHELTFAVSLATEHRDQLPVEIGQALAQVHLFATREHWRLVVSALEEPLARWEKRQKKVTEASRAKKWDELEAVFLRKHEAALNQLVRAWGLAETCSAGEALGGDERGLGGK
jgi:hypothetical protein